MSQRKIKIVLFIIITLTAQLSVFCQVVGESKASSINLKRSALDQSENKGSGQYLTDTIPPYIEIITPQTDSSFRTHISAPGTFLIGRLTDPSGIRSFTINDSLITTDTYGFFQLYHELKEGLNAFSMEASDLSGNKIKQFLYIIKEKQPEDITANSTSDYQGDYYGLIIAINSYPDPGLSDLDHPIRDATFLYSTLMGNYTFETENLTLLRDPTRADIIRAMDRLSHQLSPNDNLLIFYAGHGQWDEKRETGYWMPSDAEQNSSVNWIRNSTIQDYIGDIDTRHTLLITDACFAGSIFKTRGAFTDASMAVKKLYSLSSRKAMTSGTLKEVPDKSVFIAYFLKRLLDNDKKYLSSGELFNSFREAVLNNSPNVPQYGVVQDAGDEGGEFIFIKR